MIQKDTSMIPAILRNEIIQKHPSHKNPPLVYQATSSENDLINIFQQVSYGIFVFCSFNREESYGNGIFPAQVKMTFEIPIPQ